MAMLHNSLVSKASRVKISISDMPDVRIVKDSADGPTEQLCSRIAMNTCRCFQRLRCYSRYTQMLTNASVEMSGGFSNVAGIIASTRIAINHLRPESKWC